LAVGNVIGTNRELELVTVASFVARAVASNRRKKISANMTDPPRTS
jgi:hypothetical protein